MCFCLIAIHGIDHAIENSDSSAAAFCALVLFETTFSRWLYLLNRKMPIRIIICKMLIS